MQTKHIFRNCWLWVALSVAYLVQSCTQSGSPVAVKLDPDKVKEMPQRALLQELSTYAESGLSDADFQHLGEEYGSFFYNWFYGIMDFQRYLPPGAPTDRMYAQLIQPFGYWLEVNKPVFRALQSHYGRSEDFKPELNEAWARLQTALPQTPDAELWPYFSQFSNFNTYVDTANGQVQLGYSAEMFMDDTCALYDLLEVPQFFKRFNQTDQIPALLVAHYLHYTHSGPQQGRRMIDEAIHWGKVWATVEAVFPDKPVYQLFGYTQDEWDYMHSDEGQIWRYYLDQQLLYSTEFNAYKRFFAFGTKTFGAGIPADCPPQIGYFSGYRMVQAYLKQTKSSLEDLWKQNDAVRILQASGYNPIK